MRPSIILEHWRHKIYKFSCSQHEMEKILCILVPINSYVDTKVCTSKEVVHPTKIWPGLICVYFCFTNHGDWHHGFIYFNFENFSARVANHPTNAMCCLHHFLFEVLLLKNIVFWLWIGYRTRVCRYIKRERAHYPWWTLLHTSLMAAPIYAREL